MCLLICNPNKMGNIFYKIRRYFNPTFAEWLEDMQKGLDKELQKPEVIEQLKKVLQKG